MGWNPGRYTGYRERHMNQRSRGGYINLLKFVLCLERPKYIKKKSKVPTWWTSLKEIVGCGSVVSILASNIFIPVQLPPPPPRCAAHIWGTKINLFHQPWLATTCTSSYFYSPTFNANRFFARAPMHSRNLFTAQNDIPCFPPPHSLTY